MRVLTSARSARRSAIVWLAAMMMARPVCAADGKPLSQQLLDQSDALYDQGRLADATKQAEEALRVVETQFGPNAIGVVTFLNTLATLYKAQGRNSDAELSYQRALAIIDRSSDASREQTRIILENYAELLRKMGRPDEALSVRARADALLKSQSIEKLPLKMHAEDVRVDVEDAGDRLLTALQDELNRLKKRGFTVEERYYNIEWTPLPDKTYEARFGKLRGALTGEPLIWGLARRQPGSVAFASVLLDFGDRQDQVRQALSNLSVGQSVTVHVDFNRHH